MSKNNPDLSTRTRWLVERFFPEDQRSDAIQVLNSLGDLRGERTCFAALKFSVGELVDRRSHEYTMRLPQKGSLIQLRHCVELALTDYRDLLVWVGFGGSERAHETWFNEIQKFWNDSLNPEVNEPEVTNQLRDRVISGCLRVVVVLLACAVAIVFKWIVIGWRH